MNIPTEIFEYVIVSYLPFDTIYKLSTGNSRLYQVMKSILEERVSGGDLEIFEVLAKHKDNNQIDVATKFIRQEHLSRYIDYGVENKYIGLLSGLVEKFDCFDLINEKVKVDRNNLIPDIVCYQPEHIEKNSHLFSMNKYVCYHNNILFRQMLSRVMVTYGIDRAIDVAMRHCKIKEGNIDLYLHELLSSIGLYRKYHDIYAISAAFVENKHAILSILDSNRSHQDCIEAIKQIVDEDLNFERACTDEHRHNIVRILRIA